MDLLIYAFSSAVVPFHSCMAVYEKFKDGTVKDISDELPFEIPTTWRWVRLTDITEFLHRGKSPVYVPKSGCPMFAQKCNQWDGIHLEKCKFCSETKYRSYPVEYHLHDCDVVINSTGTGTLGRVGLFVTRELEQHGFKSIVPDSHVTIVRTPDETLNRFIFLYLRTDLMWKWMNEIADGSTKQKELYTSTLALLLIPIPPTHEQVRIMRKIEKLVPVVEEYGKLEETRLQLDADLPATLEKSILQEAIQGKLVPQDPNDEPASELLKRIANERKALVKAGKLKRDKGESVIFRGSDRLAYETRNGETVCIQDEIPFEIPDSWEWVRLGNITTFLHRGKSPTYVPHSDCPMFAQKCNQWDGIHLEKCKFCDEAKYKTFQDEYHLRDYDVVVNSTGTGTLGRVGIFHDSALAKHGYLSIVPDSHVTVVRTSLHDLNQYIYHYLCTKFCWEWMNNNADGSTKQKELYTSTLASLLIPIPPLAEQRRIASAIPLLLNNCNQLKQQPTM
jgi:type I restriction enzyme S subunit